jgi:uncharacterized membrane protein
VVVLELPEGGVTLTFARPEWLWLLALAPLLWAAALRTRRQHTRARWVVVHALRTAAWALVSLALAEPELRREVDDLAVVFVVDASASVGPAGEAAALRYVQGALTHQGAHDVTGVVRFGADAMVERGLAESLDLQGFEARPSPHQSDVAAGLRLGAALLPGDRTRRLVLLTDGEQTRGDAASQALLAADQELELLVVPLEGQDQPEVLVEDLLAPPRVELDAAYEVKVVARADLDTEAVLRLYRNDRSLGELPVKLEAGRSRTLSFREQATEPGLVRYRAQLEVPPGSDGLPQNNVGVATVQVSGRPRLLLVERDLDQAVHLATALRGAGFELDVVDPSRMPADLPAMRAYSAIVLSDVAAYVTPQATQEALESYVRDLGRGLMMVGGDESFGVGGWYKTPVERALPVRMDISDKSRFPQLGMVLSLDKSCSMGGGFGSKLGMAKEAGIRTAELLSDRDYMGLNTFDGAASWVTPLAKLEGRRDQVRSDIASIRSGGGTDIYPAVDEAIQALVKTDAAVRHIVLISDGMTSPGDYQTLIGGGYKNHQITLTTVATGADADTQTMKDFARWGGGHYYLVIDKTQIPAIFTREALLATGSFLVEEPFTPALAEPSELTRGVTALPELGGYVVTEARPRTTVALVVPPNAAEGEHATQDPLLAHGRYGLGRSVAFTSDTKARWAKGWVGTESFERVFTQVARFLVGGREDADGVDVTVEIREGELLVAVDALDAVGGFRNFLRGEARVVAPDLTVHPLALRQVGPGRYAAQLPVDQDGSWMVGVQLLDGEDVVGQGLAEAVQPYSPEFRRKGAGRALLAELSRIGVAGALGDPERAFARPPVPRQVPRPLWAWFVGLAGVVWLLDAAARRLDLGGDPRAVTARLTEPAAGAPRWAAVRPRGSPSGAAAAPVEGDHPPEPPPTAPVEVPADSYAGKLLAARRQARKKTDGSR